MTTSYSLAALISFGPLGIDYLLSDVPLLNGPIDDESLTKR